MEDVDPIHEVISSLIYSLFLYSLWGAFSCNLLSPRNLPYVVGRDRAGISSRIIEELASLCKEYYLQIRASMFSRIYIPSASIQRSFSTSL
jgi:hypothetical protein